MAAAAGHMEVGWLNDIYVLFSFRTITPMMILHLCWYCIGIPIENKNDIIIHEPHILEFKSLI
jgi:hypothetical protein